MLLIDALMDTGCISRGDRIELRACLLERFGPPFALLEVSEEELYEQERKVTKLNATKKASETSCVDLPNAASWRMRASPHPIWNNRKAIRLGANISPSSSTFERIGNCITLVFFGQVSSLSLIHGKLLFIL